VGFNIFQIAYRLLVETGLTRYKSFNKVRAHITTSAVSIIMISNVKGKFENGQDLIFD